MGVGPTFRVLGPALLISLGGSFHYGYQLSVMNPSEASFADFTNSSYRDHYGSYLDDAQWTCLWPSIVNMQTLGGLLGTFFIKYLLETFGRKRSFYLTNTAALSACLLQGVSKPINAWEVLALGRLLSGVAQGAQMGLQPVYFNEISPKAKRGLVGSLTGFIIELGFLFASIVALPIILGSKIRWPYLYLVEAVPSVIALAILPFLPESPKFSASRNDYGTAARALRYFGRTAREVEEELQEIKQELAKDSASSETSISLKTLFSTPYIRKGVFLGWMVIFSAAYSGIMALSYFSTSILQSSGVSPSDAQYATIGMTAPCCLGALLGGLIVDHFGRRPIMLAANSLMLLLNIIFIIFGHLTRVYLITWTAYANIGVAALICFTYGWGPADIMWLITAELVPQRARSTAQTLAMIVSWISIGTASLIFYPLQRVAFEFCFLLHIVPLTVSIIYFAIALPETKNKSPIEIMRALGYRGEHENGVILQPLTENGKKE